MNPCKSQFNIIISNTCCIPRDGELLWEGHSMLIPTRTALIIWRSVVCLLALVLNWKSAGCQCSKVAFLCRTFSTRTRSVSLYLFSLMFQWLVFFFPFLFSLTPLCILGLKLVFMIVIGVYVMPWSPETDETCCEPKQSESQSSINSELIMRNKHCNDLKSSRNHSHLMNPEKRRLRSRNDLERCAFINYKTEGLSIHHDLSLYAFH